MSSLILGPVERTCDGTGAPHLPGEAIRSAEAAQIQSLYQLILNYLAASFVRPLLDREEKGRV